MAVLSFEVRNTTEVNDEAQPYLLLEAIPLVDGIPLVPGFLFDATMVLAAGLRSQELHFFTCACGVPGCADFHYEPKLEVTDSTVTWLFPESPYRTRINPELRGQDRPLCFEFDRSAYAHALAQLRAVVLEAAYQAEIPVCLSPDLGFDLETPLVQKLDDAYQWSIQMASSFNQQPG